MGWECSRWDADWQPHVLTDLLLIAGQNLVAITAPMDAQMPIARPRASGWTPTAVLLVSGGIILMLGFLLIEKSKGKIAMMPFAMFRSSSFIGLTVLTFLLYGALGALLM